MNSDTGESSNNYYSSNLPLSNAIEGSNNGLEQLSQFVSLNGTSFTQTMINLSHLQNLAMQQQQQQQQEQQLQQQNQANFLHNALAASLAQNQTSTQAFQYFQQSQLQQQPDHRSIRQISKNDKALSDRSKFVVFVKVLLRYMDKLSDERLTQRTKHAIAECTRLHRSGALGFTSLSDALEIRLRSLIGDEHWNRAQNYCTYLMERKERGNGEKMVSAVQI
jgi:hypothetical protein